MTINGYEIISEWRNSTCSKVAKAQKDGKCFLVKKYQVPTSPVDNGTLDVKTFEHNKKMFDDFVTTRRKTNIFIRSLVVPGGNIIVPIDEFVYENHYIEVSDFIKGVVSREDIERVLSNLSIDAKLLLMKTAVGALCCIHNKGIVHGDLTLENFLVVRNCAGDYVSKLIGFESSFFLDSKPNDIIGSIGYYSPELAAYVDSYDDKKIAESITEKTDIFSLGLIYHFYLTGAFPETVSLTERLQKRKDKGKVIYPWLALNSGCKLQISSKIKSPKLISLISNMLSLEPNKRPTASEVLKRLRSLD